MITSLGEERSGPYLFVYFARINFFPFSHTLGVRDWLRLVIVATSRRFYQLFLKKKRNTSDDKDA